MDRKNGDNSDEDDGKESCSYCQKRFKRLDMHQSLCPLKPEDGQDCKTAAKVQSSFGDKGKDDGRVPCPYCQVRFERLDMHQSLCPLKPEDGQDCKTAVKVQSSSNDEDDDDGKVLCPYCQKRFQFIDLHQFQCPLKPQDGQDCKTPAKVQSLFDDKGEDDGKESCPYCQKRFQRLDMHQPWCHLKPKDCKTAAKVQSSSDDEDDDDGRVPCPYCQERFERLDLHQSLCPLKPEDGQDCKTAAKVQSSSDDEDEDDDAKVHCSSKQHYKNALDESIVSPSFCTDKAMSTSPANQEYELSSKRCTEARKRFLKFSKMVQMKQEDIHKSTIINDLMENVMKELNICRPLKWKKLNSGSYYSYVKVSKQDEFDYLLCPTLVQCRIEQHSSSPNYCRVFVTNRKNLPLDFRELLGPDDELFPSKFKEYAFKVFDLCLKEMENRRLVKMSTGSTCPAYTVEYKYGARNKYIYDIDWIPCLGVQDCPDSYMEWKTKKLTDEEKSDCKILVVPKDLASNDENLELWRLSYSTFEKKIIREKCKPDDRRVIRILKNILTDENDHKSKIGSYHITNHCLHMFEKISHERPELQEYTLHAINSFIDCLQSRDLPYFFISSINLLQNIDENECKGIIQKMKKYRDKWTDK